MGLAATIANDKVFAAFWSDQPSHALMHGPTFMANPLACAAANASLDLFEREPRLAQAAAIAHALRQGLAPCRNMRRVRDVRVLGAIGVVELDHIDDIQALRRRFVAAGVFVRPFGNIIYLTPALTIAPEDLAALTDAIVERRGNADLDRIPVRSEYVGCAKSPCETEAARTASNGDFAHAAGLYSAPRSRHRAIIIM